MKAFLVPIFLCCGCAPAFSNLDMGGGETSISLPFSNDDASRCTQGAGGSFSHTGESTRYGVDFDTPNDSDMEVYAPVNGTAYVHVESATSGFGYHVSIGIGDGSYVVIAHLREIFVANESEVAAGQFLGYEGCTGACTGDHVHMGLMKGDPAEMAQFAESEDVHIRVADMNEDDPAFDEIATGEFVCDISSGHVYASDLAVAKWHPDGTLVKVPNDPKVYLVENGMARHIDNEYVFWGYNWDFDDLTLISNEELACFGTGEEIAAAGSVAGGYDANGDVWLFVEDQDESVWKQRLPAFGAEQVLASWGVVGEEFDEMPVVSDVTLDQYPITRSGTAPFRDGTALKESGRSDVYVVSNGVALPVETWDTYLLLGFGERDILTLDDGLLAEVMGNNVGSCSAGIWCLDREAVTACGGGLELGSGEAGGEEIEEEGEDEEGEDVGEDEGEVTDDSGIEADTGDAEELDSDGDGVPDVDDNCPWHDNGDQCDADSDGIGDSCDLDADGDGVANGDDCDMFDASVGECVEEDGEGGEDEDVGEEVEEPEDEEETDTDVWADYLWIDGEDLCFSAEGFAFPYNSSDAYVVGYGGRALAMDFTFQEELRLENSGDAYCLDASALDFDAYEVTLVSSLASSGGSASSYADTGDWWNNYDFCTSGSETAGRFCASQGGWDYLVAFSVTTEGLFPNGDAM